MNSSKVSGSLRCRRLGVVKRGFVHHNGNTLGLDAFHDALDARLAEVVGAGFHCQTVDADDRMIFATDFVEERGDEAVAKVLEMTDGYGADAVLECVGSALSNDTAMKVARAGAVVGRVGLPHDVEVDIPGLFYRNVGLRGGPAPVRTYDMQRLLKEVLDGTINPGIVYTSEYTLDDIQEAYAAMDERRTVKSLLRISEV